MAGGKRLGETTVYARFQGFDTQIEYDGNGRQLYVGQAAAGATSASAVWRITKLTYDGSGRQTAVRHANGSDGYDFVWNDRTTYDYDPDS